MDLQEKRELATKLVTQVVRERLGQIENGLPEGLFANAYELNERFARALESAEARSAERLPEENAANYTAAFNSVVDAVCGMYLDHPGYAKMNANMAVNNIKGSQLGDAFAMVKKQRQISNIVKLQPASKSAAGEMFGPPLPGAARG